MVLAEGSFEVRGGRAYTGRPRVIFNLLPDAAPRLQLLAELQQLMVQHTRVSTFLRFVESLTVGEGNDEVDVGLCEVRYLGGRLA
jgi:hypothetical protein